MHHGNEFSAPTDDAVSSGRIVFFQLTLYVGRASSVRVGIGNDPSAGSPTETLLRLLLPLDDQV
jgi:hypothetical protein